jgi:hypothetical protein
LGLHELVNDGGAYFRAVSHSIAEVDSLSGFLRDLSTRYPEAGTLPRTPSPAAPDPAPTGSIPPPPRLGRTVAR